MNDSYQEIFADKKVAMFIFAHPDDSEIMAGGTISRLVSDGKKVVIVKMTNGNAGSRDQKIEKKELAEKRFKEDLSAMAILGVSSENNINLNLEDGEVFDTLENIEKVVKLIRKYKPDILITHNPEDVIIRHSKGVNWVNHRDHQNTGKIATYAVYPYSRDLSFFSHHFEDPEINSHSVTELLYIDFYGHEDEVFINIDEFFDKKKLAISAHKSQVDEFKAAELAEFTSTVESTNKKYERFRYVVAD